MTTSQQREVYLGYVRGALADPFWDSWPGRTFFRLLDDETLAGILRSVFSLVPALDSGKDNERVAADGSDQASVSATTDALADVMRTPLCRAALLAHLEVADPDLVGPTETDHATPDHGR